MRTRLRSPVLPLAVLALVVLALAAGALAENIDPNNDNSQFAYGENAGWLNAEPANCSGCGVQVNATDLTGYMWGENIGWVSMSCQNNSTCGTVSYGVTKDVSGNLSGYAWGENVGWISFSCQNNPSTCASTGNYGVSIDLPTGVFSGFAYGENIGWVSFSDTSPVAYQVQTEAVNDSDGDGVNDVDEDNCDSDDLDASKRPERLDGAFAGVDDDGDVLIDEALPPGSEGFDCDGDGWTGAQEQLIFSAANTANDQDPCGNNGWPYDENGDNAGGIGDYNSFTVPLRAVDDGHGLFSKIFHPVPDPGPNGDPNITRWDLNGDGAIGIGDMNKLNPGTDQPSSRPPMFAGNTLSNPPGAAFGLTCPWPP